MRYAQIKMQDGNLVLDGDRIHAGEVLRALFPDGWHFIRLEIDALDRWYIQTPGFGDFTPVGLFIEMEA